MKRALPLFLGLLLMFSAMPAFAQEIVIIKGQNTEGLFGNPNQAAQLAFVKAVDANTTDKSAGFPSAAFEVFGVTNTEVREFMRAQDGAVEREALPSIPTPPDPGPLSSIELIVNWNSTSTRDSIIIHFTYVGNGFGNIELFRKTHDEPDWELVSQPVGGVDSGTTSEIRWAFEDGDRRDNYSVLLSNRDNTVFERATETRPPQ